MPKFAEGGVISGPTVSSDSVLVQLSDCGYCFYDAEVLDFNCLLAALGMPEREES